MNIRVQKWGSDLAIRIPSSLAKKLNLHPGSIVNLEVSEDRLIIQMISYDLVSMLEEITTENMHHIVFDDDIG